METTVCARIQSVALTLIFTVVLVTEGGLG
ncbi:Uncharacterised protein [Mycobacteroides abscessus subsp. abscessus]|nr:Uncharacterised protein [Mycobacteroides abscessus subsp. abscessus]